MIRAYLTLTKPGIIYGNALAAIAGFLFASRGQFNLPLFAFLLVGTSLIIGAAGVFNNLMDQDLDQKMVRTRIRVTALGQVKNTPAILFGSFLAILGFSLLIYGTNWLTVLVGFSGFISYVFIYDYAKRHSIYGTLVGSFPGATPPLAGYTAVSGHLDLAALLLFLGLFFWQMPHFYAIAIFRLKDYTAAGVPVWPSQKGINNTRTQIILFVILFVVSTLLLFFLGFTGIIYFLVMGLVGFIWLGMGLAGYFTKNIEQWARKMFFLSLIILLTFCLMVSLRI